MKKEVAIIKLASPFVRTLREDTNAIISVNPTRVNVMREIPIYDDDDDEIIKIEHTIIGSEIVRISDLNVSSPQAVNLSKSSIQYYKTFHITARFNADLKKGDVLIREDGEKFVVEDINSLYAEGFHETNRYRKSGTLRLFKE